jgi:septal ring factor EnvC (AmiA/AmiB activator)
MYIMTQMHTWLAPHLKVRCWYIECGKTIYPVEEEEVKIAYDKVDPRGADLGSDLVEVLEEENEVDLSLLPEKERNKILNQRARDAKKAMDKVEREATRATARALREATTATEKEAKKAEKSGKSKAFTSPLFLTKTSTALPLQNPCKRDSSFAQLSMSRL